MTSQGADIYRSLMDNLSDGVMVIDFDGNVRLANPAFCRMFGFAPEAVVDHLFGEIFLAFEGLDDFVQIILDAVSERGNVERRVTGVRIGDERRSLSVSTSCLTAVQAGQEEQVAVIVVVSDITEVRELRETELRMAKVVENQLEELRGAYRDIESRNEELSRMMKRFQAARGLAAALVAGLFLLIGGWYLRPLDFFSAAATPGAGPVAQVDDPLSLPTLVVGPREFRATIALRGHLAPGRIVRVVSPVDSHVDAIRVSHGQRVARGDALVELDTGELVMAYQGARVEYIKARDKLAQLEDWENSSDMARARRALRRAKIALDDAEGDVGETAFLLEQGIVPASEHEQAQRHYHNRKLDFEEAERELDVVRKQGNDQARQVARLELQNIQGQLRAHEEKLELAAIASPLAGIVTVEENAQGKPLERGRAVSQGELLFSIADLERFSVVTRVDEVDVRKIEVGQRALISGPGFSELEAEGVVTRVSSRADNESIRRGTPKFEVVVTLDELEAAARGRLRVGMSAYVTIVVHSNPAALLAPLDAVEQSGGDTWLRVLDRDAATVERRAVELGQTTLDAVEVVRGLAAGEEIVISRR